MHLKSLNVRGFKSFASSTTLAFEPGVTCVVGPNGSGKSNVVDALAWVMGEQGAKSLRGGKMEDVIFAGTSGRAPLGRAEVSLTIDNSDGALPIDYAEVTISRVMFRSGGSEYSINGASCRLLDIQELLSDSGIGREMHVIVGQGQLDQILHATPEERRGFVEEAAGVLKHRKRKERAVRKLEAMQANLTRVQDLSTELRRQLTPLGKQAEVARRASVIQTDLRDAALRLLADDLHTLSTQYEQEVADESAVRERRALVEAELANAQAAEAVREAAALADAPVLAAAQETWFALSGLRERLAGTVGMAAERVRSLAPEPEEGRRGRAPEDLEEEARAMRGQEADLNRAVEEQRAALSLSVSVRTAAEAALATAEQELRTAARAASDRREGVVRLQGQVNAARSRAEARASEIERLRSQSLAARERATRADQEFRALESSIAGLDEGELDLDSGFESAQEALGAVDGRIAELGAQESQVERTRAGLAARVEALAPMVAVADASGALAAGAVPGVSGTLAATLRVEPGYEAAVGAALGAAADAALAEGPGAALDALSWLAAEGRGRAAVLVAELAATDRSAWPDLPEGADVRPGSRHRRGHGGWRARRPPRSRLRGRGRRGTGAPGRTIRARAAGRHPRGGPGRAAGWSWAARARHPGASRCTAHLEKAESELAATVHEAERLRFELSAQRTAREAAARVADLALEPAPRVRRADGRGRRAARQPRPAVPCGPWGGGADRAHARSLRAGAGRRPSHARGPDRPDAAGERRSCRRRRAGPGRARRGVARRPRQPGVSRSRRVSRCAPARSARGPSPAGPSSWSEPPRASAPPVGTRSSAGRAGLAPPASRTPCPRVVRRRSRGSTRPCSPPPRSALPPSAPERTPTPS